MKETIINEKLETLLHKRFTIQDIKKTLSQLFATDVKVLENFTGGKNNLTDIDDHLIGEITNDKINLSIGVTIYYILDNKGKHYITDINFIYYY